MEGTWMEDGSFAAAPGAKGKFKKGKGKGKGKKGKEDDEPEAKKARFEEFEETEEQNFESEWKGKQVCLINLKAAAMNGTIGIVKEFMGVEEVLVEGKKKKIKRYMVALEGGKGDKS